MRSIIMSVCLSLGCLGLIGAPAQASWLSQLLRGPREDWGQYGYAPNGYNQPGPYAPAQPNVQAVAPNISGVWYMSGNAYQPCQVIQRGGGETALFINERGDRSWGRVFPNHAWVADWSDGWSNGLTGVFQGNRIAWSNGSFWAR